MLPEGNAFVMHTLGGANGELWAYGGQAPLPTVSERRPERAL
ncbi:hypothetical protein [Candidatus Flexifilum breve]